MPATQPSKQFQPLCHEHHRPMEVSGRAVTTNGDIGRYSYACVEPDCLVHYSDSCGYFIVGQNGNPNEPHMVPKVRCRQDDMPMYLAEVKREKKDFRLWRCPQCGGTRTNDEDLIGVASNENTSECHGENQERLP
jgi:hypothetical protein